MAMNKKAAELSMNVIIVAAIALIVMVVLIVIFMGRMGNTRATLDSCASSGGVCVDVGTCSGNYQKETNGVCVLKSDPKTIDTTKVCCVSV